MRCAARPLCAARPALLRKPIFLANALRGGICVDNQCLGAQRGGIIFDQYAETPLRVGGVSEKSRGRVRGEPSPRVASRPSAPGSTLIDLAAATSAGNREFGITGSCA